MNGLWEDKFKRLRLYYLSEVLGSVGNARGQSNNKVRRKSLRTVRTGSPPGHHDSGTSDCNCLVEKGLAHTQLFWKADIATIQKTFFFLPSTFTQSWWYIRIMCREKKNKQQNNITKLQNSWEQLPTAFHLLWWSTESSCLISCSFSCKTDKNCPEKQNFWTVFRLILPWN